MRDSKVAQAKADLVAYEGSLASIDRQIELISEEEATVVDLVQKGLDRKPRLLALQRARADLDGQRNTAVANAARTRELIAATMTERQAPDQRSGRGGRDWPRRGTSLRERTGGSGAGGQ